MAKSKTRKSGKPFALSLATGKLDVAKNGMGYVSVTGQPVDIIIKREHLKSAMNRDTVEVDIINSPRSGKRQEGIISKIIKRGQTELIGTIQMNANFAFVIPDNESFTKDIFINESGAFADVFLPATPFAEKDGTFSNTDRRVQRARHCPPRCIVPFFVR
jgi:exoribonuclease R